jgi:hypothetical protein
VSTEAAPSFATWRAAADALTSGNALDLSLLAVAYRAFPPFTHPRAGEESPDLDLVAGLWALGGETLLGARHVHVAAAAPRALPRAARLDDDTALLSLPAAPHAIADALALCLALHVEGQKLRALAQALPDGPAALEVLTRSTGTSADDLSARFGSTDDALRAVRALAGGGPAHVTTSRGDDALDAPAPLDPLLLGAALDKDAPVLICAGATEILHDAISPYARRLAPRLDALTGASDDDARYDAIALLVSEAPDAHEERRGVEARDGLTPAGGALVVRTGALPLDAADPRARAGLRELAARRAAILLCGRDPRALDDALEHVGARAAAIALFVEGAPAPEGGFAHVPAALTDDGAAVAPGRPPSGAPLDLGRVTVPSLGLCPPGVRGLTLYRELTAVCARRVAAGHLPHDAKLAALCVAPGDVRASAAASAWVLERFARA